MDKVRFTKMHGIGNEFFIVNESDKFSVEELGQLSKNMHDSASDIHADGLINIEVSEDDGIDLIMTMFNPDGSQAEMCGNGIRCVTLYAIDKKMIDKTDVQYVFSNFLVKDIV